MESRSIEGELPILTIVLASIACQVGQFRLEFRDTIVVNEPLRQSIVNIDLAEDRPLQHTLPSDSFSGDAIQLLVVPGNKNTPEQIPIGRSPWQQFLEGLVSKS